MRARNREREKGRVKENEGLLRAQGRFPECTLSLDLIFFPPQNGILLQPINSDQL